MDVRVAAAGSGQHVVVGRRIGDMFADVHQATVDECDRGSVYQAVNEGCVRILINGLNPAGNGGWLSPIVIFESNHEDMFDFAVILGLRD